MYTECKLIADALAIDAQMDGSDTVSFIRRDGTKAQVSCGRLPAGLELLRKAESTSSAQKRTNLLKLLDIWITLASQGCDLHTLDWIGYREFYSIKLPSGRVIQRNIRTLQRNGVALQIEQDDRCFQSFKSVCEENQATLMITQAQWVGVKTYYPVKQPDGVVIQVMPNTAMNYPWRRCALVELRHAASPYSVSLITAPTATPQQFSLDFGHGLRFSGTRAVLWRVLRSRAKFETVSKWLQDNQYFLVDFHGSLDWSKKILVRRADGSTKKVQSPFQAEFDERKQVGLLRRRGRSYGLELQDTVWKGADALYTWSTRDGTMLSMTQDSLPRHEGLRKVREKGLELGAVLQSTEFIARHSTYTWEYQGCLVRATLRNLAHRLQECAEHAKAA